MLLTKLCKSQQVFNTITYAPTILLARRQRSYKIDPPPPTFLDMEPADISTNPETGLYLQGSEYRSHDPSDLDLPQMDHYLMPLQQRTTTPMHLGIKPMTHGRMICISRRSKITKANRISSYGALILGGNGHGVAGYGYGRGKTSATALLDAEKNLHTNLQHVPLYEDYTIFHPVVGHFKRTVCVIRPAPDGRGLQAGKLPHGVLSCFGVRAAYAKLYGNNNIYSRTKSIFKALSLVRSAEEFALARGRRIWELNRRWVDRPARFFDYERNQMTEKDRMTSEGQQHEERIAAVRKLIHSNGQEHLEEQLASPAQLFKYIQSLEYARNQSGQSTAWNIDDWKLAEEWAQKGITEESLTQQLLAENPDFSADDTAAEAMFNEEDPEVSIESKDIDL